MNPPRPLVPQEVELLEALQPLMRGDEVLPDPCEIEPGHFLRMVLDAWASGGGRDGRKGHLTDSDIASELERRTGEPFNRNRYQATFGVGKKMADGTPQPQPVTRPVAKALLQIALKNWDPPSEQSDTKAPDATPFARQDPALLDVAIETALDVMYAGHADVRCRKVVGFGWYGLYRELGAGGYSVVVIARDDALRMRDPNEDIFALSKMLNLLLCHERSRSVDARHIWAIRRPDPGLDRKILVRELDGIGTLKSKLKTIEYLNHVAPDGWSPVDLDRCIVAEAATYSAHFDLFDLGVITQRGPGTERPEDPIALVAVSPEQEVRFFTFSLKPSPGIAPFVRWFDLPPAVSEQIMALVSDAKAVSAGTDAIARGDWRFHQAVKFASGWDWKTGGDRNQ